MIKIKQQIDLGEYVVLTLDSALPSNWKKDISIDGVDYQTEIVYDLPNSIAIREKGSYVGKIVIFTT